MRLRSSAQDPAGGAAPRQVRTRWTTSRTYRTSAWTLWLVERASGGFYQTWCSRRERARFYRELVLAIRENLKEALRPIGG